MTTYLLSAASLPARAVLPYALQQALSFLTEPGQPQVRQIGVAELTSMLCEPIAALPFLLGHTNTLTHADDVLFLARSVAEMITLKYPGFRFSEICAALRRGVSGEWKTQPDEMMLVSVHIINKWLHSYQKCRAEALRVLAMEKDAATYQQSLSTVQINYPAMAAELAATFKKTGYFPANLDGGNILYQWLKEKGAFDGFKTQAQYTAMLRKQSVQLMQVRVTGLAEQYQQKTFAIQFRQGGLAAHPWAKKVYNNCRKRLLQEWIRYHLAQGTDLYGWLSALGPSAQHAQAA